MSSFSMDKFEMRWDFFQFFDKKKMTNPEFSRLVMIRSAAILSLSFRTLRGFIFPLHKQLVRPLEFEFADCDAE